MSLTENLAAAILAAMKQRHMSLTEFAEELGVSRTALHDYVKARGNPSASTIEHIAKKLGISTAALMTGMMDLDQEITLLLLETIQSAAKPPSKKWRRHFFDTQRRPPQVNLRRPPPKSPARRVAVQFGRPRVGYSGNTYRIPEISREKGGRGSCQKEKGSI